MNTLFFFALLTQLGDNPWCTVLPNTPAQCHAQDPKDCDGVPAKYCIWDSESDCKRYKIYPDERCEKNKGENK